MIRNDLPEVELYGCFDTLREDPVLYSKEGS